jgi:hypothetical protein
MGATQNLDRNGQFHKECICGLKGLAEYLGVCLKTAWNIKNQKKLRFYQVGRKIYFKESEILEDMSNRSN